MRKTNRFPKNYWRGLFIVLAVYTFVQLLFYHPLFTAPEFFKSFRQPLRWLTITIVYVTGVQVLKRTDEDWLKFVWHLIHLLLIFYLLSIAFVEYFIMPVPYGIRASVAPIVEFLISPLLYMGAGVVFFSINDPEPEQVEKSN